MKILVAVLLVCINKQNMDASQLEKLFEENKGDVIIKGKDGREWNVISYILKRISPVFEKTLTHDSKENPTSIIDLSQYDNCNIDIMLRYIYCKDIESEIIKFMSVDPILLCELVHIFNVYGLHQIKNEFIKWMCELKEKQLVNENKKDFVFTSLIEFPKYGDLFEKVQLIYYGYAVTILRNSMTYPCYDDVSDFVHGWCCKHHTKPVDTNQYNYEINGKQACIRANLGKRTRTDEKNKQSVKKQRRTGKEEVAKEIAKEKHFTDLCCEHRSFLNGSVGSYNYDMLTKLPAETTQIILKLLLK